MMNWQHRLRATCSIPAICALVAFGAAAAGQLTLGAAPAFAQSASSSLERATRLYNQSRYREALGEMRQSLQANANNPRARLLLAMTYVQLRQGVAAQTEIEAARNLGVARDNTRHLMAEALLLQGRSRDAMQEVAPEAVPARFVGDAARVRALINMADGEMEAAAAELDVAEKALPKDPQVKIDRARYLSSQRDIAGAVAKIDEALALQPTHVRALLLKGDLVRSTEGMMKALGYFNQALQVDPENLESLIERAATYVDLRREDEARADLNKVFAAAPEHPLALYLEAVMRGRGRDFQSAQALMARTKGRLDNYPPALLLQGVVAYETNNFEQAQGFLNKVLTISPDSRAARRLYGATQMRLGDPDGAIATLQPLFDAGEADARLYALMGSAYVRKGDFGTAQKFLEQAVEADPDQAGLRTQLAMARVARGDNVGATRDLQDVLTDDPQSLQALLMVTLIDLRSNKFDVAQKSAERLVKTYPKLPIGYNMLGAAYLGQSQIEKAEANFRKSLDLKPDYHEARRNLAQLLVAKREFQPAKRELLKVLETDRTNLKTMLALSNLAGMENNKKEQLEWLRRAVAAQPGVLEPRLMLARAYLADGKRNEALSEALALDREFPDMPVVLELVGRTQAVNQQFDRAAATYQRLVNLQPEHIGARVLLARSQIASKQIAEARRTYQRALAVKGRNVAPVLSDLVNLEADQGNFEQAVAYATQLRSQYPNLNIGSMSLGGLYMGAKDYKRAAAAYESARKQKFDKSVAVNLSQAYAAQGQTDRAVGVLRDWLKIEPGDQAVRLAVADIYMGAKNYPAALKEYEALQTKTPDNPILLNNVAWIYQQQNDRRALPTAERAYKLAPDSPEIADTLGWLLVSGKTDPRRGLLLIQKAAEKRPGNLDIQYHLAEAYRANGRPRDAAKTLEKLVASKKPFSYLQQARATLAELKATGR